MRSFASRLFAPFEHETDAPLRLAGPAECSAKTNFGVRTAFEDLVKQVRPALLATSPPRRMTSLSLPPSSTPQIIATPSLYTKLPRADGAQQPADVVRIADGGDADDAGTASGLCAC